jgi:TRAP-type mannitol/chloroaromatic compound transport system permease large subunit
VRQNCALAQSRALAPGLFSRGPPTSLYSDRHFKLNAIFYGVLPFIVTDILRLIILTAFPIIALYLPSKM